MPRLPPLPPHCYTSSLTVMTLSLIAYRYASHTIDTLYLETELLSPYMLSPLRCRCLLADSRDQSAGLFEAPLLAPLPFHYRCRCRPLVAYEYRLFSFIDTLYIIVKSAPPRHSAPVIACFFLFFASPPQILSTCQLSFYLPESAMPTPLFFFFMLSSDHFATCPPTLLSAASFIYDMLALLLLLFAMREITGYYLARYARHDIYVIRHSEPPMLFFASALLPSMRDISLLPLMRYFSSADDMEEYYATLHEI